MENLPSIQQIIFEQVKKAKDDPLELGFTLHVFFNTFQRHPDNGCVTLEQRLALFDMGLWEFAVPLLSAYNDNIDIRRWIWRIFRDSIAICDNENPQEFETVDLAMERNVLELMICELDKSPQCETLLFSIFSTLTSICLVTKHCEEVVKSGIVSRCIDAVHADYPAELTTSGLGSLKNLAICPSVRKSLIQSGALEVSVRKLYHLQSQVMGELKLGLCAASLICRLFEGQEDGPITDIVTETVELVLQRFHWLLDEVLRVGPLVIGSIWNPANIVMDIAFLAQADKNKRYMVSFVPLLVRALDRRRFSNARLIRYSLDALVAIGFDPESTIEMMRARKQILDVLNVLDQSDDGQISLHMRQAAQVLRMQLEDLGPDVLDLINGNNNGEDDGDESSLRMHEPD